MQKTGIPLSKKKKTDFKKSASIHIAIKMSQQMYTRLMNSEGVL
jgi:hypothetical protein